MSLTFTVHLRREPHGRVRLGEGAPPAPAATAAVPSRAARLLALAHRVDGLVRAGKIDDFAQAARVSRVTRARMSQITSLLNLAPDLQERVLSSMKPARGRDWLTEQRLRPIAAEPCWRRQRLMFQKMCAQCGGASPGM